MVKPNDFLHFLSEDLARSEQRLSDALESLIEVSMEFFKDEHRTERVQREFRDKPLTSRENEIE